MRTAASFRLAGRSISASPLTILKVYKLLEIPKIKVLEFKIFTIKGLKIKIRRHTGALEEISADAPPEGRRKYPRRPPPRLRQGMRLAIARLILRRFAMVLERRGARTRLGLRSVLRVRLGRSGTNLLKGQTVPRLPKAGLRRRPEMGWSRPRLARPWTPSWWCPI